MRGLRTLLDEHRSFLDSIKMQGVGAVHCEKRNHIVEVTLSNPQKKNALSGKMIYQLAILVDELLFSQDHSETVGLILRGDKSGGSFCAGLDFSTALENAHQQEFAPLMCHLMTDLCTRIQCANIVSIAFIDGYALGGGAELSTACDYRILTSSSNIGFVHAKLGASPGWGGGRRLFDIVGRCHTLHLLGTASILSATEAYRIGLATQVVPSVTTSTDDPVVAAYEYMNQFALMEYPAAVKDMKSLVAGLSIFDLPPSTTCNPIGNDSNNSNSHIDKRTLEVMEKAHEAILASSRVVTEKRVFFKRWGSVENTKALRSKVEKK